MVQLYAYEGNTRYELDLYKTEPIKINLSIDDIIDISSVESAYTQTFRIPATQNNSKFFKWWYELSTVDFDITQVIRAELHSDGLLYMSGELRLQKAYINKDTNNVDLEVVFLGNTRDFATQIAEIYMHELDLSDANHELTYNSSADNQGDITDPNADGTLEDSWKDIGSGALKDGKVRYILADRGNDFTDDGLIVSTQSEIADDQHHSASFMSDSYPYRPNQFTPIIQVKYIIDKIFSLTDYHYSDDSFFSDTSTYWNIVKDLYTDGIPEESATITYQDGNVEVANSGENIALGTTSRVRMPIENVDPSNAWKQTNDWYVAQADETALDLRTTLNFAWSADAPSIPGDLEITIYKTVNGVPTSIYTDTVTSNQTNMSYTFVYDSVVDPINNPPIQINAGEKLYIEYYINRAERGAMNGTFTTENAISQVNVASLLKKDVLITDFLKSIITKFNLVFAPSVTNPKEFIVKPFDDYVARGTTIDWSYKLDNTKDVEINPIFFNQSQDILFQDQEESDYDNVTYQLQNNLRFGRRLYDGANQLLKGRREITTIFGPTPMSVVREFSSTSNFVIPSFYTLGAEDNDSTSSNHNHKQNLPIRPLPRLLFWNGLETIDDFVGTNDYWWYGEAPTGGQRIRMKTYPLASYVYDWQNASNSLHLNWSKLYNVSYTAPILGEDVYEAYWDNYIQSLYSKDARKVTAYFVLDSNDLRNISFDDKIFLNGNYYRISKVYDALLDRINSVKVDLIKLL